jgi:pyruvate dehydrogenase E2 component (dihydrolipoamide acetyltransferase)
MVYEFKLPDIGEGVSEGEILKWMVKEGENVKEDQPLVEIMTDKVNVQIPSPRTGKISKILVKEGEVAKVGQTIVVIEEGGSEKQEAQIHEQKKEEPEHAKVVSQASQASTQQIQQNVIATPATRRLARELGVDITKVKGTGPGGRITDEDVRVAASSLTIEKKAEQVQLAEERIPLRGIRKLIAERMVLSKQVSAHVTHVDEVDMTDVVMLREALKGSAEKRGVRLTYLPLIIKALVPALKEFPYINASVDLSSGNIILKKYYNIGIATDTEQGLVVPVVKEVDKKDIFQIASEIEKLAERARAGQLTLEEVKGSTFTITNIGTIGGLFATPIINQPEVAILGVHKITKRPVVRDDRIEIRDVTYLSLTFDHRIVDGAYAARFTSRLIEILQDKKKLMAEIL